MSESNVAECNNIVYSYEYIILYNFKLRVYKIYKRMFLFRSDLSIEFARWIIINHIKCKSHN